MRLILVCACARALAPPARRLTRRDAVDAADLVGGTWAGWQREFDVEGGAAPPGYELTSSERLDGDVLERSFVTKDERSTSIVDAGRLVASGDGDYWELSTQMVSGGDDEPALPYGIAALMPMVAAAPANLQTREVVFEVPKK